MKKVTLFILAALLLSVPGCAVHVRPAVPVAQVEVRPVRPHAKAVWVKGHWRWSRWRHRYVWVRGYWKVKKPLPPVRRYRR